jgi:hypothetical protein
MTDAFGFDSEENISSLFLTPSDGSGSDNNKYVRLPLGEGVLSLRLLPKGVGQPLYEETRVHAIVINGMKRNIHCPRHKIMSAAGKEIWVDNDKSKPCPICKHYQGLWDKSKLPGTSREQAEAYQAEARLIKPKQKFYWNAIVRKLVDPMTKEVQTNVGPKILSIGNQVQQIINEAVNGNPKLDVLPLGNITNPKTGRDLKIVGSAQGPFTVYDKSRFGDASILGTEEEMRHWAANLHDLRALRKILPYEELVALFNQYLGADAPPAPTQSSPVAPAPKAPTAAAPAAQLPKEAVAQIDAVDEEFKSDFDAF